jgi:hypothetical protein
MQEPAIVQPAISVNPAAGSHAVADLGRVGKRFTWLTVLGSLAICSGAGLLSVVLGPDNYWDLRFYHLYVPWAYLHHRYLYDVAPAEYQSFFNPMADFLFYGMVSSFLNEMPRTIAFIMGAVHGLNALLVAAISCHVLRPRERWTRMVLRTAAVLIGVSGAGFVPLIGTTSNDLINSIFVLGALFGILRIAASASERPAWRGFAWSGMSAGVGLGLKYTAAVFVPGLAVVALLAAVRRRTPVGFVVFGACATFSFLALAGHHLFTLWRDFGNPTFPMLNNIFESPYFLHESGTQNEFQARNFWQLIAYPFFWVKTNSYVVAELPLRDWRGAMAYLAIIAALVARVAGSVGKQPRRNATGETCGFGLVVIFVVISYFAWAWVFGNYRYAVTLEMLTGVIVMGAVIWVVRERVPRIAGAIVLLMIAAATTVYPDWGRGRYGEFYVDVRVPPLPAHSIVLIATRQPVAFFIPYAEPTARFLGIENDFLDLSQDDLLVSKVRSVMRTAGRPKFIVSVGTFDAGKLNGVLTHFGLALGPSPCRPIRTNLENPALSICPTVPQQQKQKQKQADHSLPRHNGHD